jgi:hypothetical protein
MPSGVALRGVHQQCGSRRAKLGGKKMAYDPETTKTWIQLGEEVYPTDTPEEIEKAQEAMRRARSLQQRVFEGDPSSDDCYPNGQTLFSE